MSLYIPTTLIKCMGSNVCVYLMPQLIAQVLSLNQNYKRYLTAINKCNNMKTTERRLREQITTLGSGDRLC